MVELSPRDWVTVKTTLPSVPFPPASERPSIRTERLLLRPLSEDDLAAVHVLRSQPEVMAWTAAGVPDPDMAVTRKFLEKDLPPRNERTYDFAICLAETGALIGVGGSHRREGDVGWPVLGYLFVKEAWGKGYATEFLKGFLDGYWKLPRCEAEVRVDRDTLDGEDLDATHLERMTAIIVEENDRSRKVLEKSGMRLVKVFEEEDLRDMTQMIQLFVYAAKKPS